MVCLLLSGWENSIYLNYTEDGIINDGTNSTTKSIKLLSEDGSTYQKSLYNGGGEMMLVVGIVNGQMVGLNKVATLVIVLDKQLLISSFHLLKNTYQAFACIQQGRRVGLQRLLLVYIIQEDNSGRSNISQLI